MPSGYCRLSSGEMFIFDSAMAGMAKMIKKIEMNRFLIMIKIKLKNVDIICISTSEVLDDPQRKI